MAVPHHTIDQSETYADFLHCLVEDSPAEMTIGELTIMADDLCDMYANEDNWDDRIGPCYRAWIDRIGGRRNLRAYAASLRYA